MSATDVAPLLCDDDRTGDDGSTTRKRARLSRQQRSLLAALCATNLCVFLVYSLQAPFFPAEVLEKGGTATWNGFIFSAYQIAMLAASLVFGRYVSSWRESDTMIIREWCKNSGRWARSERGVCSSAAFCLSPSAQYSSAFCTTCRLARPLSHSLYVSDWQRASARPDSSRRA